MTLTSTTGTSTDNFLKRWIAFLIGGVVALIVEVVLLPVKARTRLVEAIGSALVHISDMEKCIASGIEEGTNTNVYSAEISRRFGNSSVKANGALTAAEMFRMWIKVSIGLSNAFQSPFVVTSHASRDLSKC